MREGLGPGSAPPPPLVPAPLPRASPGSGSLALHTGEGTETGAARTNRRGPARWRSGSASGLTHAAPPRASSLVHWCFYAVIEDHHVGHARPAPGGAMFPVSYQNAFLQCALG